MGIDYHEGDWFAITLPSGSTAVGLIARAAPRYGGALFGYFFRSHTDAPTLEDVRGLSSTDAAMVCRFGHVRVRDGTWPIVGRAETWDRTLWPMPSFLRTPSLGTVRYVVTYDDRDPGIQIRSDKLLEDAVVPAVSEDTLGPLVVEHRLERLLK